MVAISATLPPPRPRLQQIDREQEVIELLELDDDEQRHDLGISRHVAGDEDHGTVLPDRSGERERKAGEDRRQQRWQDDPGEDIETVPAEKRGGFFVLA